MGNYVLIYRSSKKQSEIELMMEKACKRKKNFAEDEARVVRTRRGVLEMLESVMPRFMKPNVLT